jgi:glyoxylase-like metal-dependent hydrolase (beta-lactamase superfamily II)
MTLSNPLAQEKTKIRRYLILISISLVISGCQVDDSTEAGTKSSLKLYIFDCGMLRFDSIESFTVSDDESDIRDFIVPCYVVEHENGRLLWDGGLPSKTADVEGWQGKGMLSRLDRTFGEQLPEIGLDMSSFDYAAYSHMHFDHVGVANEVIGATLIIQQEEYDAAFADEVTVPGFDPELYSNLRDAERILIDGDHDVFGDGRVRIISAPGHTPGHQVLFIDLENSGPVVLSGDLYHLAISRQDRRVPAFNVDKAMTLASMDRVEALVEETGATFWIEHELALFEQLNKAPAYYD